jgi:hypothetical protein
VELSAIIASIKWKKTIKGNTKGTLHEGASHKAVLNILVRLKVLTT